MSCAKLLRPAWLLTCSLLSLTQVAVAADFAGTNVCRGCHEQSYRGWQGSHHDLAMQHADADTVLGDFDDAEFTYGSVTSRFFVRDGEPTVRTDGPDGRLQDFPVAFTFGVTPLQQYLIAFPDGRLQALGIAWDSRPASEGGQRWFHLYPDQAVSHRDPLHWTRPQQNWNYMCAACHSTGLQKGYDPATDRFDTTWAEIDVGCEACHGPGSQHVAWAALGEAARDGAPDKGLSIELAKPQPWPLDPGTGSARPRPPDDAAHGHAVREIEMCAACHSRRGQIAGSSVAHQNFLDVYRPALLSDGLYHADGQIDDEVFVWGSFVQSRMHEAGVRCSDCHEPHSLALRAPGDSVCAQCHLPARFASEAHHHHQPGSAGASCLDCHMPESTYMVVDPRRDHSLRVPRPDRSVALGIPNACNDCHTDRTAEWAAARYREWYPDAGGGEQVWAETFAAARAGDPRSEDDLVALIEDREVPAIARATAVENLQPFLSPRSAPALQDALGDASALVRLAALQTLDALPPPQRYPFASPALSDDLLAVRAEAGRVLAALPAESLPADARDAWRRAVADYEATQAFNADRPEAQTNLASLYAQRGETARARAALERAIALDPAYVPAYANLADLVSSQGDEAAAVEILTQGLSAAADAAVLHHALGLTRVRLGEREAALHALERAATLAPDAARFAYVYAVALNGAGQSQAALAALRRALEHNPYDRDLLFALATMSRDAGELQAARDAARRLLTLYRGDSQAVALGRALGIL